MPGCQGTTARLSLVLVWLERSLPHHDLLILCQSLLLTRQILGLLHSKSLFDSEWREAILSLDLAFTLLEKLVGLAKNLWMVTVLLTVVLLLECTHQVTLLLVKGQLVLTVRVQINVLSRNELDLFGSEKEASVRLATYIHCIDMRGVLPFQIHNVLMVEVLNGPQKVLAVSEWNLTLPLVITSNTLPDVCKHKLFLFLRNWADEAKFQEKLRHLSAPDLDLRLVSVSVLWLMHDLELVAGPLKICVEPVMNHLVRQRVDLDLWQRRLLLQVCFLRLPLLLSAVRVLQDRVEVPMQLLRPLTDLWIEFQVLVLLPQVVLPAHLLLHD